MMRFFKGLLSPKQSVQEPALLKPSVVEPVVPVVETPPVEVLAPVAVVPPVAKSTKTVAAKPIPPKNSRSPKSGNAKPRKSKNPLTKAQSLDYPWLRLVKVLDVTWVKRLRRKPVKHHRLQKCKVMKPVLLLVLKKKMS